MRNILQTIAKSVLIVLGLTAIASAADPSIHLFIRKCLDLLHVDVC